MSELIEVDFIDHIEARRGCPTVSRPLSQECIWKLIRQANDCGLRGQRLVEIRMSDDYNNGVWRFTFELEKVSQ